jgi:hypothetical protein
MKGLATIKAATTGEELATHRIPLVGRFYGNVNDQTGVSKRFYDTVMKVGRHDLEIDGLRSSGKNVAKYIHDNPESRLVKYVEREYREVQALQKRKRQMAERKGSEGALKLMDANIKRRMTAVNKRYESASR